ncbi:MAG: ATP-binding protein [Hormoscilla sp. SP5CHS1]|nr:ATP-binding protein [Hormoscilla sp. SP5CHS1]
MNHREEWQTNNNNYLAAATYWLRLRLGLHANIEEITAIDVAQAEKAMVAASQVQPPPAAIALGQQLNLSEFEGNLLLLCVAMEWDGQIPQLCALIQGNQCNYPTFALAFALFDGPSWDVVSPERPIRYWRLIEILQSAAEPMTTSPLRADERIVNYIKGLNHLDDRLQSIVFPWQAPENHFRKPESFLPPSQQVAVETIIDKFQLNPYRYPPPMELRGPDRASKQMIAGQVCLYFSLKLYRLPVAFLPTEGNMLEILARLWERESQLQPIALYLEVQSREEEIPQGQMVAVRRFLERSNGFFFIDIREKTLALERETITLDIAKPTVGEQIAAWEMADLTDAASVMALVGQFNLSIAQIQKIVREAQQEKKGDTAAQSLRDRALSEQLWDNCLQSTRPELENLAQRIEVKASWEDIVLPEEETKLLHQIANQVRQRGKVYEEWGFHRRMNRGKGISALFAGESGTGKTMAAEVIATDLRLHLYRIDLATVVSKYIGETEKNLRRLFDAAEDGGAILFFDEADALFGKRSEVKDAHDRHANIEIDYLLQRLEAYRGLAILATNLKSSLDRAFLRRLRFIVNFPAPGVGERKRMWSKVFPPETPTEGLDLNRLTRFNLTGGNIHNIALNAAFMAAEAGTPVTMKWVLAAARMELRKLERPINEADFRN